MKDSRRKTAIICGGLALAGVSLNYWFAIRRIDYFGAFSGFPNEVSTVQYMIAVMVLIGGLAYSFLVLLRGLEGKFPLVMTVLPFLSVCLYRLDFVWNLFANILPFVLALIQFTLGFVPSWLWVLIFWILRLFHISGVLHTIIMALLALLLAAIAASAYNVQLHIISKAGRQAFTAKDTNQKSRGVANTARSANTSHINREIHHYEEEEQMTDTVSSSKNSERGLRSMYEERGYFLSGDVWWNGSRKNGSCSVDLLLEGKTRSEHAYKIHGNGWDRSGYGSGEIQMDLSVEAINGNDRYRAAGSVYYDSYGNADINLDLSGEIYTASYSIRGYIDGFSLHNGYRRIRLDFDDLLDHNGFGAEGSYNVNGIYGDDSYD